jgi:hypothetical protein
VQPESLTAENIQETPDAPGDTKKTLLTDAPDKEDKRSSPGAKNKTPESETTEPVKEVIENKKENSLDRPRIVKNPADDPANKPKNKSSTDKKPKT